VIGLLAAQGYAVAHASDALAALAEFEAAPFDAALIDLDLPGIDGFALARMLHQRHADPPLPLIGISARSTGTEGAACRSAGMVTFLRKPLSGEALHRALVAAIAATEARDLAQAIDFAAT